MIVGALIGLASSVAGLYVSYYASVAAGAAIVLVATFLFMLALVFSPRRGLLAELRRPAEFYEIDRQTAQPTPPDLA